MAVKSGTDCPIVSVAVLVDLPLRPQAGGHVKCWERLAAAAVHLSDRLDLTVHFAGPRRDERVLAPNVRYCVHEPVFSSARLPFLPYVPEHSDLAPFHAGLARTLNRAVAEGRCDVLHTTDGCFAFARTAEQIARRRTAPLVNSIHTDTARYTAIYTEQAIAGLFGRTGLGGVLIDRLALPTRMSGVMWRRLQRHHRHCAAVLVSQDEEWRRSAETVPIERLSYLRRGVDRSLFHPDRSDRHWLEASFDIPPEHKVLLAVGRLDATKRCLLLGEACVELIRRGRPVLLLCVGDGDQRPAIMDRLGDRIRCPGFLPPEILGRIYASADVLVMPSVLESYANTVVEALASGVPVFVSGVRGAGARLVRDGVDGCVIAGDDAGTWADAIDRWVCDPALRMRLAAGANETARQRLPSWLDVLREDLLPVWRQARRVRTPRS